MRRLFCYLAPYRKECLLGPLFKLLEASFELMVPLVVAKIIDEGISKEKTGVIFFWCLVMALLAAGGFLFALIAQYFAAKASTGFAASLKNSLFAHLQSLSFAQMDQMGPSGMIARLTSDTNQLQTGVNLSIRLLLRSPFVVFGAMAMSFFVDWQGALIFCVAIPLLAVVVFCIILGSVPLYQKVQRKLESLLGTTRENLLGVRVIRAFGLEKAEEEKFEAEQKCWVKLTSFANRVSGLMNPLTYFLLNIAIILLVWVGAIRVEVGLLTQGGVFALYQYMSQILVELIKLANLIVTLTKSVACGRRISQVFSLKKEEEEGRETSLLEEGIALSLEQVSFSYPLAGSPSLEGLTFSLKQGETVGVIGSTGSGKSTLCQLIARCYPPSQGKITLFGKGLESYESNCLTKHIHMVPQTSVLFSGTVRENLLWGDANASEGDLWNALERAGAKEFVARRDGGLDAKVEQEGANFSGGQRQRLCLARALMGNPSLLLLDDSFSALDGQTERRVRTNLYEHSAHQTVIIVSQRISSIRNADRILVLEEGRLVGNGTHEELLASCQVYQEIEQSQRGGGSK